MTSGRVLRLVVKALVSVLCLSTLPRVSEAKRVVLIDLIPLPNGQINPAMNSLEGYENARGWDYLSIGGSLTDGLAHVADGDQLDICAHGFSDGRFVWGGIRYTGFGIGPGLMPVPATFNPRHNVRAWLLMCYGGFDPDGLGPNTSIANKLLAAMGGAGQGNIVLGMNTPMLCGVCPVLTGGNPASRTAARLCLLDDPSWQYYPPSNGGRTPTQEMVANEIIAQCAAANGVTLVIPDRVAPFNGTGYLAPTGTLQCAANSVPDDCGCVEAEVVDPTSVPLASPGSVSLLVFALSGLGSLILIRRAPIDVS